MLGLIGARVIIAEEDELETVLEWRSLPADRGLAQLLLWKLTNQTVDLSEEICLTRKELAWLSPNKTTNQKASLSKEAILAWTRARVIVVLKADEPESGFEWRSRLEPKGARVIIVENTTIFEKGSKWSTPLCLDWALLWSLRRLTYYFGFVTSLKPNLGSWSWFGSSVEMNAKPALVQSNIGYCGDNPLKSQYDDLDCDFAWDPTQLSWCETPPKTQCDEIGCDPA